jgi:DNA repair photolyase
MLHHIHGKAVYTTRSRIFNPESGFKKKLLCTGPTFSPGTRCAYSCSYCYAESIMAKQPFVSGILRTSGRRFQDVVIRREAPLATLRQELRYADGSLRFKTATGVVYGSPLVDVAATEELAQETIALCAEILDSTGYHVRLLSKSPLLVDVARSLPKERMIYGLSTETLEDDVARTVEPDAPPPSRRLEALKQLQAQGYRTFAMLCPILPQDATAYVRRAAGLIHFARCEHLWAEVLNARGASTRRTLEALEQAGLSVCAKNLETVTGKDSLGPWETYARRTFAALAAALPAGKLRFLQYVTKSSRPWWANQQARGAILLS